MRAQIQGEPTLKIVYVDRGIRAKPSEAPCPSNDDKAVYLESPPYSDSSAYGPLATLASIS